MVALTIVLARDCRIHVLFILPHVRGKEPQHRVDGYLIPHHLIGKLCVRQLASVLVRPGMAGNLVAFGMHSLLRRIRIRYQRTTA